MSINFIPNDPDVAEISMRKITPRSDRPPGSANLDFVSPSPVEKVYDPDAETQDFLFWQTREAVLAALEVWETITGAKFSSWQSGKKIFLIPDRDSEANAFYDRSSLSFFHFATGGKSFYSGASTDVVAHETGHGLLDSVRPDLWDSAVFEANAFHEAWADCIAILTALHDAKVRAAVLASIHTKNFLEGTAENLSRCIKEAIANGDISKIVINAAAPRRARNNFKWQLPSTLPDPGSSGDGPGALINEIHSFGQLFSGSYFDAIINIFDTLGGSTSAQLLKAAQIGGLLLSKAIVIAPAKPRFFREVGRAMVKVDETDNGAANRDQIRAAFEAHNIPLGTGAMLQPVAGLAGAAPKLKALKASLSAAIKKDLRNRIDGLGKVTLGALRIGGQAVAHMVHERLISCGDVDKRLKGVYALAHESVLVGNSGGQAAILGSLPDPSSSIEEVETYVHSLVKKGAIDFGTKAKTARAKPGYPLTHKIKSVRGKKMLVRFRFACGTASPRLHAPI